MIIGSLFAGRMKTLENQWIETQFFTIGIPLIPVKSMFVTKSEYKRRQGFEIGLNGKSVLKGYMSFLFLIGGVFMLLAGSAIFYNGIFSLLGLLLLGASMYFFFIYGKSTEEENEIRNLFQKAVGINALPEYLDRLTAMNLRNKLINGVKEVMKDKDLNWIDLVENKKYDEKLLPALFAAMGYHSRLEEKDKFYKLFEELKVDYKKYVAQHAV